jgi:hypothetical protein
VLSPATAATAPLVSRYTGELKTPSLAVVPENHETDSEARQKPRPLLLAVLLRGAMCGDGLGGDQ